MTPHTAPGDALWYNVITQPCKHNTLRVGPQSVFLAGKREAPTWTHTWKETQGHITE